jgi:hypothetical protein
LHGINRPLAMRKDGIQTRKRKPKKTGSAQDVLGMVKKEDMIHSSHHDDMKVTNITTDRSGKLILSGSPKLLHNMPKNHLSPITHNHHHHHSHLHHSQGSYAHTSPLTNLQVNSSTNATNANSTTTSTQNHSLSSTVSSHLYTSPLISSVAAAAQNNLHNSYLHNTPTSYGAIKSESNIPGITNPASISGISGNYDYMSNCIQNGYFGLTNSINSTPHHSDLSGYHHQHNVIQAAKLMATS